MFIQKKYQLFAYLMYFEEKIVAKYALFCDYFWRFGKLLVFLSQN